MEEDRYQILVVDDDEDAREMLRQFLENQGYGVLVAENGQRAIRMVEEERPDLVLMDANMPLMDGFAACSLIRGQSATANIPIVMVTVLEDSESVNRAFAAGAEEYITKPIRWAVLRQRIRKILIHKATEKSLRIAYEQMESRVQERTRELQQTNERLRHHRTLLQASELKFRSLVEGSPDVIMILDRRGRILFSNRVIPPLEIREIPGANVFGLLPPRSRPRYKQALDNIFHLKESDTFRIEGPASTWWQVRVMPLPGHGENQIESAMVIATNTTEKHNLQAKAMQNARLATVGTLAAGVAHEVNNPNNAVLLQAEWLADAWPGLQDLLEEELDENADRFEGVLIGGYTMAEALKKIPDFISGIIKNTRRVGLIASNLKRMSRPNSGRLDERVRIDQVMQSAQSILANQINKYTDFFLCDCQKNLPEIQGNPQQLEQVFINLILNALQSLKDRRKKVSVRTTLDVEEQKIVVKVQDEGVGIPENNLDKIMDPFFTTRLEQGGTGLGLAISHSIVNKHGGCMEVTSEPGRGTVIMVNLPVVRPPSGGSS